ncbi:MAG TPA: hypothetical protein VMI73_12620 [Trebonia sp.]|nr:hypothetical protein [Trebonia sp.]
MRVSPAIGKPGEYARGNWIVRLTAAKPARAARSTKSGGSTSTAVK